MNKAKKVIITFIISFIVSYLIVGYIKNGTAIKWAEDINIWGKLKWYYVLTVSSNILPTLILSTISTSVINSPYKPANKKTA